MDEFYRELENFSNKNYKGFHKARFLETNQIYHVINRTFQGQFLLNPDEKGVLEQIIIGVIVKAKERYPSIRLYADSFLSNHTHQVLSSTDSPKDIADFMAYFKREVARRWNSEMGRKSSLWDPAGYKVTALLDFNSQIQCFKYVMSQGTKEGLVQEPLDWPCKSSIRYWFQQRTNKKKFTKAIKGKWFNGTLYSQKKSQFKRSNQLEHLNKADYYEKVYLKYDLLPYFQQFNDAELKSELNNIYNQIKEEGKKLNSGTILGKKKIFSQARTTISSLPEIPWTDRKSCLIAWINPKSNIAQEYLQRFWNFQRTFRIASNLMKRFKNNFIEWSKVRKYFPENSWLPGTFN